MGRLRRGGGHIADIDILRNYLGLLSLGKSDFHVITGMRDDDYFRQSLGIGRVPSTERFRQRLDEVVPDGLIPLVFRSSQTMLKQFDVKVSGAANGLASLDVRLRKVECGFNQDWALILYII